MVKSDEVPNGVRSHKNLLVWQRSIDMTVVIYAITEEFPAREKFGLSAQMRRAAVSVPSNIAEGHARGTREYLQFLLYASGSNAELETQLVIARKLGLGRCRKIEDAESLCSEVGEMLTSLLAALRRKLS